MTERDVELAENLRGTRRAPAGGWRTATVREITHEPSGVRLSLHVPERVDHWPGQHYVMRLTAEDGYTAQRSYSVASDPGDPLVELWVETLPDGEVSGFLAEVVEPGDQLEVRGPIGGWFVWTASEPMLGVAGGSGVVPLVAMLRHAVRLGRTDLLRLAVAARTLDRLPYADEFAAAGAFVALSRADRADGRPAARLTGDELAPLVPATGPCLVCGSSAFTGAMVRLLTEHGTDVRRIRIESFGFSG